MPPEFPILIDISAQLFRSGHFSLARGSFISSVYICGVPHLALLAELYIDSERFDEALATLEEPNLRPNERMFEVEILRLKAVICMRTAPPNFKDAESLLVEAIEVARRQEAKSLELRSSVELGKLLQQRDNRQEARDLVAPIYNWFTEGFDSPDLKEAKALLEELS